MLQRNKITIVGAGNVGASTAQKIAEKALGDIVLVDIVPDLPQGKALDLQESGPICGFDSRLIGTNRYDETEGSDIVIITSGIARKPGMSRDELLKTNVGIVKGVTQEIVKRSPGAVLIIVSNPLDAMTYVAAKVSGFPRERIMGMAGVLDSARFRTFIALELGVSVENIQSFVLGGHGKTMIPLIRYSTVAGMPVSRLINRERLDHLIQRTREGGAEIVGLLKTGSAYYAPAASITEMVEAVVRDKKKILPCAALCKGEYGINGLFVGVPAKLGIRGVEQVIEFELSDEEAAGLQSSAEAVRALCRQVDALI
jgi:malate dehydrogenase